MFDAKCVVMHGEKYGSLIDWDADQARRFDITRFPRAQLAFEAQAHIMQLLQDMTKKLTEDLEPQSASGNSKWLATVQLGYRCSYEVETWSPYANRAFSAPPRLELDYLVTLAQARQEATGDHLTELQNDSNYMDQYLVDF
jgi:hypothetical protein